MPSFVQYFDKQPIVGYSVGPEQVNVPCPEFSKVWVGDYNRGISVTDGSSSLFVSGSNEILFADSLSICFDSGANLWAAVHRFEDASIFKYTSSGNQTFSFEGKYPQLFNDFIFFSGGNTTYCFYLKSGKEIYYRSSINAFSTEKILCSGNRNLNRLTSAFRYVSDLTFYRLNILGLDENSNGVRYVSDLYDSREGSWIQDFEGLATGERFFLSDWHAEPKISTFLNGTNLKSDPFMYEDGEIHYLSKYNGFFVESINLKNDSFLYEDGKIFTLSKYSGFFTNGTNFNTDDFSSYSEGSVLLLRDGGFFTQG